MPLSGALLMAATLLWMLDASLNVSMEPFRAFVGDMPDKDQHTAGYAVQTAFIGAGAVAGSLFPWLLDHFGVANQVVGGGIPDTVRYSFWAGGIALFLAVLWTVLTTREYSPQELLVMASRQCRIRRPILPLWRRVAWWRCCALGGGRAVARLLHQ
ncbi:MAG: hypothetical protein R3E03_08025 [Novosphingobium sp.]